jgi:hypothetical protein
MGYNPYKVRYSISLVSYGLLSIYIFVSISRSVFKYRTYGLSLYLLICLLLAVVSVVGEASCMLKYYQIGSEDFVTAA